MLNRKVLLIFIASTVLVGCPSPKTTPRYEHDAQKTWTPTETPTDDAVKVSDFSTFNLATAYKTLEDKKADLMAAILVPLSRIVLNSKFIAVPRFQGPRLTQMIHIFNAALIAEILKPNTSAEFKKIKEDYYATVFDGCARDLRVDCTNATVFAGDSRHTLAMTLLARELDAPIEAELKAIDDQVKKTGKPADCIKDSEKCRTLTEERYRRLSMGVYKKNRYQDPEFSFTYLKYARLFAELLEYMKKSTPLAGSEHDSMSTSYLAQVHGQIFETIITKYTPSDINDPEFRKFVENFNPWTKSRTQVDLFQYGTGVMFELGTKCCLYQDKSKTKLSESVNKAIELSQSGADTFDPTHGLSFRQMTQDIKKEHDNRLFKNLGLSDLIARIEGKNSSFYNEYFFMVDRLFRGHLNTDEVEMMLKNTNQARANSELPKMVQDYIKIYLVYMVVETNRFMAGIYRSDISSDKIFEETILRSREISGRWYTIQAQIDLLDKVMNRYFKTQLTSTPEYIETYNILKAVNRNIHYISAFPNMIVMNYFLSKMKGKITINTWWGPLDIDSDTILKGFFDGAVTETWFRFGKDTEKLDRLMLLYSLEYMLSTETLNSFVAKDATTGGTERSKFFDLIFGKYLDDNYSDIRGMVIDFQRSTSGNQMYAYTKEVCDYETNGSGLPRRVVVNFLDLTEYTYSGLGENGINQVLNSFLTGTMPALKKLIDEIETRKTYVKSMIDVIEGDLLRSGAIAKKGDAHPDLTKARASIKQLDDIQDQLTAMYLPYHKAFFNCAVTLREVERRRANRLYDEEREHLGMIFDKMKPLFGITDSAKLDQSVAAINDGFFRAKDSPYKFDRVDGLNYRMSKYDLLMRMKKRIESDIFSTPTAKERQNYGADLAKYNRSRSVTVDIPEGIVRDAMYAQGTSTTLSLHGTGAADREDFINQGLALLNGKSQAFVKWAGQIQADNSLFDYLTSLETFYLLQTTGNPKTEAMQVTAEDLANAYIAVLSHFTMDAYDIEYARPFGLDGRHPKAFYQGMLFERDGMTRLPLFYSLMNDVYAMAEISIDSFGPVRDALTYAKNFNSMHSMQAFVFAPSEVVENSVKEVYGQRAHNRLQKVGELFRYIADREAKVTDARTLDPRLAQPFYVDGDQSFAWFQPGWKNMTDIQRLRDHKILVDNFIQRSGNFFGTREKVKNP